MSQIPSTPRSPSPGSYLPPRRGQQWTPLSSSPYTQLPPRRLRQATRPVGSSAPQTSASRPASFQSLTQKATDPLLMPTKSSKPLPHSTSRSHLQSGSGQSGLGLNISISSLADLRQTLARLQPDAPSSQVDCIFLEFSC